MFSKANSKPVKPTSIPESQKADSASSERSVPSIISADLTVTGDLQSAGEIQIDGRVEGDIRCSSLIIGISGGVTGEIKAERIRMHGSVNGQVNAKSVFLSSTARMNGDISHESLAIEPGAYMEGHCRRIMEPVDLMLTDGKKAEARRPEKTEAKAEAPATS
ncbi:MAG: polymer-forming cytoskeletal protein [Rhodospirillum sp.]|nr:polymer-forming cytoskeletal protein [Rhodospirillum sp.]MCF8491331.1 polymer-forming cytoskeletal protein [Rhodospirillum sp.]MCF8503145.1 polymer-forming cytoskeletal protein [Rhodospirillum sp.]